MFLEFHFAVLINIFLVEGYFRNGQVKRISGMDVFRSINAITGDDSILKEKDLHLSVWFDKRNKESMNLLNDISNLILMRSHGRCVIVDYENSLEFKSKVHYQVILLDTFSSLEDIYRDRPLIRYRSLTLIYFSSIGSEMDSSLSKALKLLWQLQVLNVGIIVSSLKNSTTTISMVTYFPYTPNSCEVITPVILNRYNRLNTTWMSRNYFPDKVRNLYGCHIKCAALEEMPYFQLQRNDEGNIVDFQGMEGLLLKFLAGNLNFTPEFYVLNHRQKLEILNEDGGLFEKLFKDGIKFVFGALQSKSELNGTTPFSQSNAYFTTNIYLVVNHIKLHRWYIMLVRPLQMQVWLLIGLSFAFGFIIISGVGYFFKGRFKAFIIGYQKNATPYYNMFVTFLGGIYSQPLPKRNFARYIITLWLLSTLVLRSAYQSGLYEILRDQLDDEPPQTINEVIKRNYVIKMIPENLKYLRGIPDVKRIEFLNTNELQAFAELANETTHRIGILTPYENFGYFRKINQTMSQRLTLVGERILNSPLSFYLPKNSFLLALLDQQIVWCHNNGFVVRFLSEYLVLPTEEELGIVRSTSVLIKGRDFIYDENVASLNDLGAIFILHAYLLLLTCCVFAAELLYANIESIKGFIERLLGKY